MKNFTSITFFMLLSFFTVSSSNAASLDNEGGGVELYFKGNKISFVIEKERLSCFQALQTYANTNMKKEINAETKNFKFEIPQGIAIDDNIFEHATKILIGLCDINVAQPEKSNDIGRINKCMDFFKKWHQDYLAQILLTAYELGEYLQIDSIIQRAIVNQMYDKIFTSTEEFDYEKFENYLINPKDFEKEIKSPYLIDLSGKGLRSANLSYLLEKLKSFNSTEKKININLSGNQIRDIVTKDLVMFKNSNLNIVLDIRKNPLLLETKDNIKDFQKKYKDPTINKKLKQTFKLEIRNLKKKSFASFGALSLFSSLIITQLLKKASPLITLVPSKKLQVGIKLGSYLLPVWGFAYVHYRFFKNSKEYLNELLKIRLFQEGSLNQGNFSIIF